MINKIGNIIGGNSGGGSGGGGGGGDQTLIDLSGSLYLYNGYNQIMIPLEDQVIDDFSEFGILVYMYNKLK